MTNSNQRRNQGSTIAFEQFAVMAATLPVHLRKQVHCTHQSTLYISRVKPLYTHSNNGWKYNVFFKITEAGVPFRTATRWSFVEPVFVFHWKFRRNEVVTSRSLVCLVAREKKRKEKKIRKGKRGK